MPSTIEVTRFPSIYPPRPAGAIHPSTVSKYAGYLAQYKYDDIRIVLLVHPDGRVELLGRKRQPIKSYALDASMRDSLRVLRLKRGKHHLLDGGLMRHAAGLTGRRSIVLWDILIHDDRYLLGTSYERRYAMLQRICGNPRRPERDSGEAVALAVAPSLWLAPVFRGGFDGRYARALGSNLLEGLVLKDPRGALDWGVSEENNGSWQVRVRKSTGRHVF